MNEIIEIIEDLEKILNEIQRIERLLEQALQNPPLQNSQQQKQLYNFDVWAEPS